MTALMDEIVEQPAVLAGVRKYYTSPGAIPFKRLRALVKKWPPVVIFTGMGSSLFATYPVQAYLTALGIRAFTWETAELLHYHLNTLGPDALLVVVSQSGETVEVVRLIAALPKQAAVLATVNVEQSSLARRANLLLPMMAGAQSPVSTKTFMCSVAALMYLGFAIAGQDTRMLTHALRQVIEAQEYVLDRAVEVVRPTVEFFDHPTYTVLMARGPDLATAYQGALMLKEIVRLGAEGTSAAQFRHGPIEVVNMSHRYVIVARKNRAASRVPGGSTINLLSRLAEDIRSHGGRVMLLTDTPFKEHLNTRIVRVEPVKLGLGTLVDVLHIQLMAHELALRAGLQPGKLWIAEKVTRIE